MESISKVFTRFDVPIWVMLVLAHSSVPRDNDYISPTFRYPIIIKKVVVKYIYH